jgi:hypothetical protein
MKRTDAFEPLSVPSADDPIPELTEWARGMATAAHAGFAVTEAQANFAAKPPTLYLDTTIVSYLTARFSRDAIIAQHQSITRRWWRELRTRHLCYISDVVEYEAARGDVTASRERLDVLKAFAKTHVNAQTHELAGRILTACRLPQRVYDNAHHAAITAFHGLEVLLTWNCRHLANPNMIPHIRRACEAYGYAPPAIHTPEQLIGVCAYP